MLGRIARILGWSIVALLGLVAIVAVLALVFGLPLGPVLTLLLFGIAIVVMGIASLFTWYDDFDGQIARSRIIGNYSFSTTCSFQFVALPENAQQTPFAVSEADTNWMPKGGYGDGWRATPTQTEQIGISNDKLGEWCSISEENIERLARAANTPGGWMIDTYTGLDGFAVYSAPERFAAWIAWDR